MNRTLRTVVAMALLRLLSGTIELVAATLMVRYRSIEAAFRINGILGLVGPAILIVVSALGLAGLAGRMAPERLFLIAAGVTCILVGTRP